MAQWDQVVSLFGRLYAGKPGHGKYITFRMFSAMNHSQRLWLHVYVGFCCGYTISHGFIRDIYHAGITVYVQVA